MNKTQRLQLLERLIKEGAISLLEAVDLLETEKEYVYYPNTYNPSPITYTTGPSSSGTPFKVKMSNPYPVYSMDKLEEMYRNQFPGEFPGPTKL